jgi:hypothetical protein
MYTSIALGKFLKRILVLGLETRPAQGHSGVELLILSPDEGND